ncbi:Protein ORAOV1 [Madurella mycetomatis]|uniref:Protein ORAOV1 n=1 Tax=Madurella mycetomatis TaxID=100816 RepID=A0A175WEJ0_9PEZI|nr:Protein ORAOV1 [Madurella mycetomatis]
MATTSTSTAISASADDPFDALLGLEDDFYNQGYNQGLADGLVAGRTEGRQLGLERGFQKFVEAGRLQGRAIVWANRLRVREATRAPTGGSAPSPSGSTGVELPPLPQTPRLEKHVRTLYALAETESLSTENTDEAVNDFDDRLRRAQGRAKIIERMVGEGQRGHGGEDGENHDPGAASKGRGVAEV